MKSKKKTKKLRQVTPTRTIAVAPKRKNAVVTLNIKPRRPPTTSWLEGVRALTHTKSVAGKFALEALRAANNIAKGDYVEAGIFATQALNDILATLHKKDITHF